VQVLDAWWMGAYTSGAREIDDIAYTHPEYLIVHSAGNSGTQSYEGGLFSGYDKLTGDKNAKNNLVIANSRLLIDPFTAEYTGFVINSSSSQGPTDDLRIKPDLAGVGTALYSPVSGDGYATYTGTSMSAPNVTGTLALLQQYYKQLRGVYMKAATLKGLVCLTAEDDAATAGPDPIFGWGLLDAKKAAELIQNHDVGSAIIDELTLNTNDTFTLNFTAQAGDKLMAVICWTDVPGVSVSGEDNLNNSTPILINDLDLRITKDGITFFPWKLDFNSGSGFSNSKADNSIDNVERIDIAAPVAGEYTLTVSHKGTLVDEIQNFSLILTGSNVVLGVEDNNLGRTLRVFPNPSNGEFTIGFDSRSSNDVKIDVYDLSGRAVYNETFINAASQFRQSVNLGNMQPGIYVVRISEGDNMTSHKIVIE
jgi:hypothetical protein